MRNIRMSKLLWSVVFLLSASYGGVSASNKWEKYYNDSIKGCQSSDALIYLQKSGIKPQGSLIVGVIDSGIDTSSIDLKDALWINSAEKLDGKDNDKNGYVDDLHGWNFLGTSDGTFNMKSAGTEEYRQFKRLYPKYKSGITSSSDSLEYDYYLKMKKKAGIGGYMQFFSLAKQKHQTYLKIDSVLNTFSNIDRDTITVGSLYSLPVSDISWKQNFEVIAVDVMKAGSSALWRDMFKSEEDEFCLMKTRIDGIEHAKDKRLLMGDKLDDPSDRFYGNTHLMVDGYDHGMLVAGEIAGQGIVDSQMTGIYPAAKLMIIRAIPDGDEYDKDVASSIRYAVDNGAKVINMSFGKYTSPTPDMVNDAIAYAQKKDVLIIQAAGNSGWNIDSLAYFPSGKNKKGLPFSNLIRVGASGKSGQRLKISNEGTTKVDIFAPGAEITSVAPDNTYQTVKGTSIAAPVVSAVAAMLRHYFPKLKASEVKDILIRSASPAGLPCKSRGIVNALNAVKLAAIYTK